VIIRSLLVFMLMVMGYTLMSAFSMLIFYAHPNRDGHSGCFLKYIEDHLKGTNTPYEVIDLYRTSFNPILKPEEHYTSGHYAVGEEVKKIQEKINGGDRIASMRHPSLSYQGFKN